MYLFDQWEKTSFETVLQNRGRNFHASSFIVRGQAEGHGDQRDVTFRVNEFPAVTKIFSAML